MGTAEIPFQVAGVQRLRLNMNRLPLSAIGNRTPHSAHYVIGVTAGSQSHESVLCSLGTLTAFQQR